MSFDITTSSASPLGIWMAYWQTTQRMRCFSGALRRPTISGSDGEQFELEEFQRLGGKYWEAFSNRTKSTK
jgi:hypothetical protein